MTAELINGARTSFGPRTPETELAASVLTLGVKKQLVVPVKYDQLPTHLEDDVTGASLPANALITAVYATPANVAFAGGTSYDVNLVEDDGTAVTTVSTIVLADLNSGAEATVADATVGTAGPVYVEVAETGTFTAGEGAVVIEYIEQLDLF
tara:strand:- start:8636 stop:9091 length:456 start_codon:yes stop_codon:yes gene_type:complete